MSMSLEEAAMLSWNQPVITESVNQEIAAVNEDTSSLTNPADVISVVQEVNLPLPINLITVENVNTEQITEPVIYLDEIKENQGVIAEVNEYIIPLEGLKPIGDISQQDLDEVTCNLTESLQRLEFCKKCPEFKIENMITKCSACNCSISMVTTFKYKACPAGNW